MKYITLQDGSKWPDPLDIDENSLWHRAEAYRQLIMNEAPLQQVRDKISQIRQAAGRPRIPPRKLKKSFLHKGVWYTWKELKEFGVPGLNRQNIITRQRLGWDMERILKTPVRKMEMREKDYKGFANKEDHYALHECDSDQRKTLGLI